MSRCSSVERMVMCVAGMHIFVAHFLLLRILADSTPPASVSVPLVGKSRPTPWNFISCQSC